MVIIDESGKVSYKDLLIEGVGAVADAFQVAFAESYDSFTTYVGELFALELTTMIVGNQTFKGVPSTFDVSAHIDSLLAQIDLLPDLLIISKIHKNGDAGDDNGVLNINFDNDGADILTSVWTYPNLVPSVE